MATLVTHTCRYASKEVPNEVHQKKNEQDKIKNLVQLAYAYEK